MSEIQKTPFIQLHDYQPEDRPKWLGVAEDNRKVDTALKEFDTRFNDTTQDIYSQLSDKANIGPPKMYGIQLNEGLEAARYSYYCKTQENVVFMYIAAKKPSGDYINGEVLAMLPAGFRPLDTVLTSLLCHTVGGLFISMGYLYAQPNGVVKISSLPQSTGWVTTETVCFVAVQ